MDNPKISFVIPVYNAEKKVGKCIGSIQKQTYKNLEIICVNDGSKDNSLAVLKKLRQKDGRIKIIDQENQGIFYARKTGVLSATGDYILFSDNDDKFSNDRACERIVDIFRKNPDVQLVQFAINLIRYHLKAKSTFGREGKLSADELKNNYYTDFLGEAKRNAVSVGVWDKAYEAKLLKDTLESLEFKGIMGEDLYLNLAVFDNSLFKNVFTTNEIMYDYNVGVGASSKWDETSLDHYSECKKYQNFLCDKWGLEEKAKHYCNLESIYMLLLYVIQLVHVKKSPETYILEYLRKADSYESIRIAKDYFRSRPKEELSDELIFLVNAAPEEYLHFVKTEKSKPENVVQRGIAHLKANIFKK